MPEVVMISNDRAHFYSLAIPQINITGKEGHSTAQHSTTVERRPCCAVLCCGLEKNGMFEAWHGHGMARVNQTRPHCVNQMGFLFIELSVNRNVPCHLIS